MKKYAGNWESMSKYAEGVWLKGGWPGGGYKSLYV
jgi:hypothetical protein